MLHRRGANSPLLAACANAHSWQHVLKLYGDCCATLRGIYTPSSSELRHGLQQMPNAWSTSLFYYSVVKGACGLDQPEAQVVTAAMMQFKKSGHVSAMKRLLDEDLVDGSVQRAKAAFVLTSYTGLWEEALQLSRAHPHLVSSPSQRRTLISCLCSAGKWRAALGVVQAKGYDDGAGHNSALMRPIVKHLSVTRHHAYALHLVCRVLSGGDALDLSLFSAIVTSLRNQDQWKAALETAQRLGVFSLPRSEVQRHIALLNQLVACLYEANLYSNFSIQDVVTDVTERMEPKEVLYRPLRREQQFRLFTQSEVFARFHGTLTLIDGSFSRALHLARWHTKGVNAVVTAALQRRASVLVVDTNFVMQCVSKHLPIEHFYPAMASQIPSMNTYAAPLLVVPFTVIEEMYSLIWSSHNRLRHSVKLLLWSRVVTLLQRRSVYSFALSCEYPTSAFGVLSKMAYDKMGVGAPHEYSGDPDLRLLNVCLAIQYGLRHHAVNTAMGTASPEGPMLFSFLKYHVRRYNNTVKGVATDQLIFCSLDRRASRAAAELGIQCFPDFARSPQ